MADPVKCFDELKALNIPMGQPLAKSTFPFSIFWEKGHPDGEKKRFLIHSFHTMSPGNFGFEYIPEGGGAPKAHNIHPMMVHDINFEPENVLICTI